MHDVPKESISFPDYVKLKIMGYLVANFAKITSTAKDSQINSIGLEGISNLSKWIRSNEVSSRMNGITKIKMTTVNLLLFNTYA